MSPWFYLNHVVVVGSISGNIMFRQINQYLLSGYTFGPLVSGQEYTPAEVNDCTCNTVRYSLISACAACQDGTWLPYVRLLRPPSSRIVRSPALSDFQITRKVALRDLCSSRFNRHHDNAVD